MIQNLCAKIWGNPQYHQVQRQMELAWLRKELGVADDDGMPEVEATKLMRAAAILACSDDQAHRKSAFRAATCTYELFGATNLPLDQALRVVLGRLGNFPSFETRQDVSQAQGSLPLSLAAEEILSSEAQQITVNHQTVFLTGFQHGLWNSLRGKQRVTVAAPTSAGKSFVLQKYLSAVFEDAGAKSVVYLVPTRALIAQVAEDLSDQFIEFEAGAPEIVTIPLDTETALPQRAIYVMTQERAQLMIGAHPTFAADIVVVDEAHSIAEGARGVLLQWVIDDLLARNGDAQVLFASPTIRNLDVFARLFGLDNVVEFASIEPTVAQNFLVVAIDSATKGRVTISTVGDGTQPPEDVLSLQLGRTIASRIDKLVHIPAEIGQGQSNIVYANGAAEAQKIAYQLSDLFDARVSSEKQLALSELAREAVHPNYVLAECLKKGVAYHYSNIPTQLRRAIEAGVSAGDIDYLICTSTLLQGVNLPTKNIFMCMPEKGKTHPLESTDFWNLAGRAGRLRREFQGNIFLIDYKSWKKKSSMGRRTALLSRQSKRA